MILGVTSLVLLTAASPRVAFPHDTLTHRSVLSSSAAQPFVLASELPRVLGAQSPSSKDPLRNGAIIGAIVGGVSGLLLSGFGCEATEAIDDLLSGRDTTDGDCAGPVIIGTIAGTGLGALLGVGVDAMFERAPYPAAGARGVRKGIRLSFRF